MGKEVLLVLVIVVSLLARASCEEERSYIILGTQKGLVPYEVRVFLASLRSTGCLAKVVIMSAEPGRADLQEVADTFDAEIVEYYEDAMSAERGPMNLHRFTLFREYLERAAMQFDQILLCDIRDVMFQRDPFLHLSVESGIAVALEPAHLTIGACPIHVGWLTSECPDYDGKNILPAIGGSSRSCAGTVIGTQEGILSYCSMMEEEAARTVREVKEELGKRFQGRVTTFDGHRWKAWCNDQGMHNKMLWTGDLEKVMKVTRYDAETSLLATVGTMKRIHTNEDGEVLTGCGDLEGGKCYGDVVALVHQYDRVELLVRNAQSLYGLPGESFLTFHEKYSK